MGLLPLWCSCMLTSLEQRCVTSLEQSHTPLLQACGASRAACHDLSGHARTCIPSGLVTTCLVTLVLTRCWVCGVVPCDACWLSAD